jgi:imidazolonepropionase-like amidohydrolase
MRVAGHVPATVTAVEASAAGQTSTEHMTGLDEAKVDAAKARGLAAIFRRNGTWLCPTLIMRRNYSWLDDATMAGDPRIRYAKASWRKRWLGMTKAAGDSPAEEWERRKRLFRQEEALVGMMRREGVGVLAGTDVANPYCVPGFSLHEELALLVEAGLTPAQALRAATADAARFLGRLESSGTVAYGKLADLVLLDADPLDDVRNTTRIRAVVARGRYLDRAALDRLLAAIEAAAGR